MRGHWAALGAVVALCGLFAILVGWVLAALSPPQNLTLVLQTGHGDEVTSVAFSPDGRLLASGSQDKTVIVWDALTGEQIWTLDGRGRCIDHVGFTSDGRKVLGIGECCLLQWDLATGEPSTPLVDRGDDTPVFAILFAPDGAALAVGCSEQTVTLREADTGELWSSLEGHAALGGRTGFSAGGPAALSSDGRTFACGIDWGRRFIISDLQTGQRLHTIDVPKKWPDVTAHCAAFSPDGRILVLGQAGEVALWEAETGHQIGSLPIKWGEVYSLAFSPDGRLLAAGGGRPNEGCLVVWDAATWEELYELENHRDQVNCVAFSPDGFTLAAGCRDRSVRLCQVRTGVLTGAFERRGTEIRAIAISASGRTLAETGACLEDAICLWDLETGAQVGTLQEQPGVDALAYSPGGRTMAIGCYDALVLRDMVTGEEKRAEGIEQGGLSVRCVAFSPDERLVAVGGEVMNTTPGERRPQPLLAVWDAGTGEHLRTLEGHGSLVQSVAFSADSHVLASTAAWSDKSAVLWNVSTGERLRALTGDTWTECVAFSPDGSTIAVGHSRETLLWHAETGERLHRLALDPHQGHPTSLAFSPDGRTLATATFRETVLLWDVASGQEIRRFSALGTAGLYVTFTPDGRMLATASRDGTVRLWDPATGELRARLWPITERSPGYRSDSLTGEWVTWTPDGHYVCSEGGEDYLRVRDETGALHLASKYAHIFRDPERVRRALAR